MQVHMPPRATVHEEKEVSLGPFQEAPRGGDVAMWSCLALIQHPLDFQPRLRLLLGYDYTGFALIASAWEK